MSVCAFGAYYVNGARSIYMLRAFTCHDVEAFPVCIRLLFPV